MKNIAAIAFFLVASFVVTGAAPAQDRVAKATIPFNFIVGDQMLPSGTYTIGSTAPIVMVMRNRDRKIAVQSLGESNSSDAGKDNTLVFHKVGNHYFLSDVRSESASIALHFPTTKAEKWARQQAQEAQAGTSNPVLVALN